MFNYILLFKSHSAYKLVLIIYINVYLLVIELILSIFYLDKSYIYKNCLKKIVHLNLYKKISVTILKKLSCIRILMTDIF